MDEKIVGDTIHSYNAIYIPECWEQTIVVLQEGYIQVMVCTKAASIVSYSFISSIPNKLCLSTQ